MSGDAQGWAWQHGPATKWGQARLGLKRPDRSAQAVLVAVGNVAGRHGERAHPGVASIVDGTGYSRASVMDALARLVMWGYLEVEEQGGGRGKATIYRIPGVSDPTWKPSIPSDLWTVHGHVNGPESDPKQSSLIPETVQFGQPSPLTTTDPTLGTNLPASGRATGTVVPRDHIWDAVIGVCHLANKAMTEMEKSKIGKVVTDLIGVGATPGEISHRARVYRRMWPDVVLTPTALAANWSTLDVQQGAEPGAASTPKAWDVLQRHRTNRMGVAQ